MPRAPRIKGEESTYHVIGRGNERREIFRQNQDKERFLETLARTKTKFKFNLYGYCLMNNHIHLIIDVQQNDISQVMKSLNVSYVRYFNSKYKRVGHLFQDRFKSELVYNERYLLEVSRYIHRNPVKAKIVRYPVEYKWSSYNIFLGLEKDIYELVEPSVVLDTFSENRINAIQKYRKYVESTEGRKEEQEEMNIIDVPPDNHFASSRKEVNILIENSLKKFGLKSTDVFAKRCPNIEARNHVIQVLHQTTSLNLSEIGDLFGGLTYSSVSKIINSN